MRFDKLLDVIKVFLEKYLVPTVLSVILTFITFYKTPEDFNMLVKFTVVGYCVFVFCIWLLVIVAVMCLIKKIINIFENAKEKAYIEERRNKALQQNEMRDLELLWTDVDGLSLYDYNLIMTFLRNGNQPHYTTGIIYSDELLNSEWVHCSRVKGEKKIPVKVISGYNMQPKEEMVSAKYQYILRQEIYELLKYSQEKYGKISHFK